MKMKKVWMIVFCLMVLFLCQCEKKMAIPVDFIGVWETASPDYADYPFEIKTNELLFGTGDGGFNTFPISRMKTDNDLKEQKTVYIIFYKNTAGQEYKFSFYYDPANQGTIRFKNQKKLVWTKKPSTSTSQ